ncbi:RNA polymerase sigma factor [Mucilaginibacter terrae]|uniref:RNA polymerase sigma factor n=1 Tax=Mucilaginibacter terrae TaxID=1955052 RepID=UPI0036407FA6
MSSDKELLKKISEKDQSAMAALHSRYFLTLCKTAFKRLRNEQAVEEIVQDVFVNVWIKATDLEVTGDLKAYLFATLRNKILHEIRRVSIAAKATSSIYDDMNTATIPSGTDYLEAKELEQRLFLAIKKLPPQCQEAFTLSRFEQLSYKAIAERMNISVNTVEKHVGKALNILRKELGRLDISLILLLVMLSNK